MTGTGQLAKERLWLEKAAGEMERLRERGWEVERCGWRGWQEGGGGR